MPSCRGRFSVPTAVLAEMPHTCSSGCRGTKHHSGEFGAKGANPTFGQVVGIVSVGSAGINAKYTALTQMSIASPATRKRGKQGRTTLHKASNSRSRNAPEWMCRKAICSYLMKLQMMKPSRKQHAIL